MPPKKLPRLEKGQRTLFGSASSEGGEFPNLIKLAAFAVSCPVQTADCERGFSAQNRILTALRNRLNPATQNKLMAVKLGKVGPVEALDAWKAARPRVVLASNRKPLLILFKP